MGAWKVDFGNLETVARVYAPASVPTFEGRPSKSFSLAVPSRSRAVAIVALFEDETSGVLESFTFVTTVPPP
jgi:hypothetical protein